MHFPEDVNNTGTPDEPGVLALPLLFPAKRCDSMKEKVWEKGEGTNRWRGGDSVLREIDTLRKKDVYTYTHSLTDVHALHLCYVLCISADIERHTDWIYDIVVVVILMHLHKVSYKGLGVDISFMLFPPPPTTYILYISRKTQTCTPLPRASLCGVHLGKYPMPVHLCSSHCTFPFKANLKLI